MGRVGGEADHIFGLHDYGGESKMVANKGWIIFSEAIGRDPDTDYHGSYNQWIEDGYGVIVRLNHGYGDAGTIPYDWDYGNFAKCAARFITNTRDFQGAGKPLPHIWIIGNETNLYGEWPRYTDDRPQEITPWRYAACFKSVRNAIKTVAPTSQVVLQGISPATHPDATPYPDPLAYYSEILELIGRGQIDGIALHTYTGTTNSVPPPDPEFLKYRAFLRNTPEWASFLPVYITETNPNGWTNVNNGWVRSAYWEIDGWNRCPANQTIRALALYRWQPWDDPRFVISDKPEVVRDFLQAASRSDQRWIAHNVPHGRFFLQRMTGGSEHFECVVAHPDRGFQICRRVSATSTAGWYGFEQFGQDVGRAVSASVIQSNFNNNLEVVGRIGTQMVHLYRDVAGWHVNGTPFGSGCRGAASLIQSREGSRGHFEIVVPLVGGGFAHYRRKNDTGGSEPFLRLGPSVDAGVVFDAVSLIQSTYGNLEVVGLTGGQLRHYYCTMNGDDLTWVGPVATFGPSDSNGAASASGSPGFVQARFPGRGNFVVVTPMTTGGLAMYARENDNPNHPWVFRQSFGAPERYGAASVLHSTNGRFGTIEAVVRATSGKMYHWWRDAEVSPPVWRMTREIAPSPTGEPIEG